MALELIVSTPASFPGAGIVRAAFNAGYTGALSLECCDSARAQPVCNALYSSNSKFALVVSDVHSEQARLLHQSCGRGLTQVILTEPNLPSFRDDVRSLQDLGLRVLVQAKSITEVRLVIQSGANGMVVKGNESGGSVGEETTFILLQRAARETDMPIIARGGIGLHTAAGCLAAGVSGLFLDWQVALCEESELPQELKSRIACMDGSETVILGHDWNSWYRILARSTDPLYRELKDSGERGGLNGESDPAILDQWRKSVEARAARQELILAGQDACFASDLATEYKTVRAVGAALQREAARQCRVAARLRALSEHGALAQSHRTRFPIAQGPMTRVSDCAAFALAVAEAGALPFLALALMSGPEVAALLKETKEKLGDRPWGIGILGFVPKELREEQLAEARKYSPPFAVIAGGRPDQAKLLESEGTQTYLHVPSPQLLRSFLEAGARKVIFEGRECGGHVGPRSSFVLWESMIGVILKHLRNGEKAGRAEEYHVLFAGGVHDALSASMVSALAAPLSERGVKIGVLLGTAYLFTKEAVRAGAITDGFQKEAIACSHTILLETGVGHATRCANTAFGRQFAERKRDLILNRASRDEIREELERLNLGRLRIAAKGIARGESENGKPTYLRIDDAEQRMQGMYMIGQVAALRDGVCGIEDIHREVASAADCLEERFGRPAARTSGEPTYAIVGLSCILPKAANLRQYWCNIWNKVNAIVEVPKSRWQSDLYFDSDRRARDKVYSRWGGFLDDTPFDPVPYGMPPSSVSSIEPMQLLTLDVVREALRDAGYNDRRFDREHTSVIVGTGGGVGELGLGYGFRSLIPQYVDHAGGSLHDSATLIEMLEGHLPEWTEDSFAGLLLNVVAGRVANRFDLGGTNYIVDAACATSLAALRLGLNELESHSSDVVIVAASDMMQTPFGYLCFSKTQALSPTGQCRTFDETADGIVISEGIAAAVIKRLDDAERDGDQIHAILRSVGSSSDGRDKGLTAPRPIGQIRALDRAYRKAGVSPETVGLLEAHGTGTVVGDRTEVESLSTFFRSANAEPGSCALGSVKSLVGHTKCTAGFAGLIKAVMALEHRVLPPTAGVTQPNKKIDAANDPFYLNTEVRPWFERADGQPRRAGVSAFGFGGTNFHAVLEEYRPRDGLASEQSPLQDWPEELFLFRGSASSEISDAAQMVAAAIRDGSQPLMSDLAAAVYWDHGRRPGTHCFAVVAKSLDDLASKLDAAKPLLAKGQSFSEPRGIYYSPHAVQEGSVAFLLPGQGSQRTNMLVDLALAFPCVRRTFEEADAALYATLRKPLTNLIFPPPAFTSEEKAAQEVALKQTRFAQPALGAAGIATYRLLRELGVYPDMAAGHSYGEFVALCAAGAMSFSDLCAVSEGRGRLIVEAAAQEPGTMAAVDAGEEAVRGVIGDLAGVTIANLNSPLQTVISGTAAGVDEAAKRLRAAGIQAKSIPVSCAFHSELVAGAQVPLRQLLDAIDVRDPCFPVFSNTTAAPHANDANVIRDLLSMHLAKPVNFNGEVLAMHDAGARTFIECGPGRVLSGLASQILARRPFRAVHLDQPGRNGLVQLCHALAQLASFGVPLLAQRLFEGRIKRNLPLTVLLKETAPRPLSATAWMISAGRAIPAQRYAAGNSNGSARSRMSEGKNLLLAVPEAANGGSAERALPTHATRQAPPVNGNATPKTHLPERRFPAPASNAPPSNLAGALIQRHRSVMTQMLQSHRRIMMTALAGAPVPEVAGEEQIRHASPEVAFQDPPPILDRVQIASQPPKSVGAADRPVVEQAVLSRDEIKVRLLQLVTNRTGYPPEMLDLELDMEADFGIDSIKRVEIFGELQSIGLLPAGGGESEIETLSKLKTLGAIVDLLVERATATFAPGKAQPLPQPQIPSRAVSAFTPPIHLIEPPAQKRPLIRMLVKTASAPLVADSRVFSRPGWVLITDDEYGVARYLAADLEKLGVASEILGTGMRSRLDGFRRKNGPPIALVHLQPLRPCLSNESPLQMGGDFEKRLEAEIKSLFHLSRELENDLRSASGSVIVATAMGGVFAIDDSGGDLFSPASGAVCGWVKTLSREWPEVSCKVVDFEAEIDAKDVAEALLAELVNRDGLLEVGYREGSRLTLRTVAAPLEVNPTEALLTQDSVVLITGGARGITAEVAIELARRFHPRIILVGRTPLGEEPEATELDLIPEGKELKAKLIARLQESGITLTPSLVEAEHGRVCRQREIRHHVAAIEAAGSGVEYHAVDVGDAPAFNNFLQRVYQRFGRIDGVIHGAGVIEDKLVRDKTEESFERVMRPKINGALTLCRNLRLEQLSFLAFFSSVSARYGNRGQGDYAAANEVLNKLATWLNARWPARVVSFNWGPWETAKGMVTSELASRFAAAGVQMVSSLEGREAFINELESGHAAEVIFGGPIPQGSSEPKAFLLGTSFPLLRSVERIQMTEDQIEFLLHVDLDRHIHLRDHQLDGVPVMPVAMILELAAEVASLGWPDLTLSAIRNLSVLQGITFTNGSGRTLRVQVSASAPSLDGTRVLDFRLGPAETDQILYRAQVDMTRAAKPPAAPATMGMLKAAPIQMVNAVPLPMSVSDAYQEWLFHGPLYAGVEEVEMVGDNGIMAMLQPSSPENLIVGAEGSKWVIDPVIVDSALQLLILWARMRLDQTPLPSALGCYHLLLDAPTGRVRCEAQVHYTPGNPILHANIRLLDDTGRLIGWMEDMRVTCSRELNRLAKSRATGAST